MYRSPPQASGRDGLPDATTGPLTNCITIVSVIKAKDIEVFGNGTERSRISPTEHSATLQGALYDPLTQCAKQRLDTQNNNRDFSAVWKVLPLLVGTQLVTGKPDPPE